MENLEDKLFQIPEGSYGADYKPNLLEQYKLYVEMADRISARRQAANSFFLGINTALLGALGFLFKSGGSEPSLGFVILLSTLGIVLDYAWYRLIRSYKDINTAKFKVIHALESKLPASPYDAEWAALGEGSNPKLYLPFTRIEIRIPWIFMSLYSFLIIYHLPISVCIGKVLTRCQV